MVIVIDFFSYNRNNSKYCLLVRYDVRAISYAILLNSVLLVAYQYWHVANKIYNFTLRGVLPNERKRFRNKSILVLLSVLSGMATIIFLLFLQYYSIFGETENLKLEGDRIELLIKVFIVGSFLSQFLTLCFYSMALQRLYKIMPMA